VDEHFIDTYGVKVLDGRNLTDRDRIDGRPVATALGPEHSGEATLRCAGGSMGRPS